MFQWRAVVNTDVKHRLPYKARKFLTQFLKTNSAQCTLSVMVKYKYFSQQKHVAFKRSLSLHMITPIH